MTETLLKNFTTIKSLIPFLRSSLRQTMIRKLSKVGKDKAVWKKDEECLTQLQDDDHMLTLEDTDVAIKRAEQYTSLTWVLVALTVCFTYPVLYRVSSESRAGEWEL